MRLLYVYSTTVLIFISILQLNAQCPPPGFPEPGNTCPQAPILCENLDGYCSTINNNNVSQSFPGCSGPYVLNNDEWFAFFAGTTSITIQVTPSNCSPGGNMGLQGGIYQGCGGPVMDVQCACETDPFILTSNSFIVGQVYWMVLDGCGGNVCDYSIDVLAGSTVGVAPNNPGPVNGPMTVCPSTTTGYNIAPVTAATSYAWTMSPQVVPTASTTNSINVNWPANFSGTVDICVTASNLCYSNPTPSCTTVEVIPTPTATLSGSGFVCAGGTPTPVPLSVAFTGTGPWSFVHTIGGVAQPPIVTSDNPYTLNVTQAGTVALQSVNTVAGNCPGTVSGNVNIQNITVSASSTTVPANCGLPNGSINVTAAGGTPPYTFLWSNGETTEDLSDITGGTTYTVTVTSSEGCTGTHSVNLVNNTIALMYSASATPNTTCIGGNGSATILPNTYFFEWSTGATTNSLTDLPPGTYSVTISAGGNCTQTISVNILDQPNTPSATTTTVPSTCELPNGDITTTVTGGVTPYTFSWSNGETTQNLNDVVGGNYVLTVTGANGCTTTTSVNLSNNNPPITITPTVVANTTCNGGNGSISIAVSPAGSYTYEWGGGETTTSLTGLTPGSYVVTVFGGGACTQTANINVPDNPNTPTISASTIAASCGLSNGSINVNVSGGVTPYTYTWSNGETTPNLTNVPGGTTYDLTVTGANGCTTASSVNLSNSQPTITITPTVVPNTTCNGGNGSISLSISPVTPPAPPNPYTFNWSTGATTSSVTGLAPGSYQVTVSGGGDCTATADITVPDNPNTPILTATPLASTCDLTNGAINLGVSGGVTPYTFNWSNGAATQNISGVLAGSYDVTVTGANGCSSTTNVVIANNNPPFNINQNIVANTNCSATGNGAVSLTVTPPPGPYTFMWFNGATTNGLTMLQPGTYAVTVSAGGSCTQAIDVVIPDNPDEPQLSFSVVDATCGLSNGSINLSVSGSTTPYTYQWSSGQVTQDISNIPPDAYFVTVTGGNGCTNVGLVNVDDNPVNVNINGNSVNNTSCLAAGNGSISITYTPGYATFTWSNNATTTTITGLLPGEYTVTVSAGGSCTETETFTIDDDAQIPDLVLDVTAAVCGLPNGSIDLSVSGGTSPYTYSWSTGAVSQDLNNLAANDYFVTVTSAVGCSNVGVANVADNDPGLALFGAPFENTSCALPNGNIYLDVFPDNYVYVYQWSNGSNQQNQSLLAAGFYTVTVTLGNCTASETFEVANSTIPPNLSVTGNAATCGIANGSAIANASGGVTPYTYKWSNNSMSATASNILPGIYTVTVTGANGCSATASVTIPNNTISINITGAITANTSCTSGNGAINITVTPSGAYNFVWSNAAITEDLANLPEGTYTVTVTQGVNCSATAAFIVVKNTSDPVITPSITAAICGQSDGAIDLSITGAITPYTYTWSNMATTEDLNGILSGTYTVTVNAANGCTAVATLNVANNSSTFSINGAATPYSNCTINNGAIDLTVTPAGVYAIEWSNMTTTEDLTALTPGTYTVTVTQTGTCSASATFIVDDATTFPTLSQNVTPEICGLSNGGIDLTVNGGAGPFTFFWTNAQTLEDLTSIPGGLYTVTVTGSNNCTATTSATVPNNAIAFTIDGATSPNSSCSTINGGIDLTITPAGTYTFTWSNVSNLEDLSGIPGGTYTVTVSAGGTCTNAATYIVDDITNSPTIMESVTPALCDNANGAISLSVSGSTTPYSYNWSVGGAGTGVTAIPGGTYTVTVTGANGCSSVRTINVPNNTFSPSITGAVVPNSSCTIPNGEAEVSVSPAGNYTYLWNGGQNTSSLAGLPNGSYTVTVSAGGACTAVSTLNIPLDTELPAVSADLVNALCSQPSGSIATTVSGALAPYFYQWSNNTQNSGISGVLAGTYTLTVTASNGCTTVAMYTLDNESNNFNIAGSVTPNTSCLAPNGSINVSMLPMAVYSYQWSTSAMSEDISNLSPGSYTVTVTDASGCAIAETFTLGENITDVVISGISTDILCFGSTTGAIDLTVSAGTPAYIYKWQPLQPGNPQDLNNLPAGNYAVTVTDVLGCTAATAFTISQPATGLNVDCDQTKTVSLPGATDGEGTVTVGGGTSPYTIDWEPGGVSNNVTAGAFSIPGLAEGSYGVTITDANGCTINCGFNIGLVDCMTEVGTMSTGTLSACGNTCITAVYNATGQVLDPEDVLQFVLHEGSSNAIVNELARNNQPQFCFNPANMSFGTTYYISAVAGNNDGNGHVILTDFCTVVSFGSPIVFYEKPVATANTPAPLTCINDLSSIAGASSLPGATFQWTTSGQGQIVGNANAATIAATGPGNYQLIIDANGCADTVIVTLQDLKNQPQAVITADPSDILDCSIDQIILSGTVEGTSNANTIWLSGGAVYATGSIVPVNDPGTFTFIALDTLSFCADTAVIVIDENQAYPPLFINPPGKITCAQPQITISGGSPFTGIGFRWVIISGTDTTTISNSSSATVTQPGTYYLIGYDPANTCTNIESLEVIGDIVVPIADAGAPFTIDCFGETLPLNGNAAGGANLAVLWSTQDGNLLSGLQSLTPLITLPGTYTLVVTNTDNGCTATDNVTIPPDAPVATLNVKQPPCFGDRGTIDITSVSGGAPPVRYSLNGQALTTTNRFTNLTAGVYNLLVVDAQGCTTTATATIIEPALFDIDVVPETLIRLGESYLIEVNASLPPSQISLVQWTPSEGLSCDTCLTTLAAPFKATKYEVRAVNDQGCEDRATVLIRVDTRLQVYAPNIINPDGAAPNNKFTIYTNPEINMSIKSLEIYSRWGELLFINQNFAPNDPELGWDGRFNGTSLNPAVFVWKAIMIGPDGKEFLISGDVTIDR